MIEFIDTHCHIHEADTELPGDEQVRNAWEKDGAKKPDDMVQAARENGVTRLICVGTTAADSQSAVTFVQDRPKCWASIGIHPHETRHFANNADSWSTFEELASKPKVVAIGECGLDYFYNHSPKAIQIELLKKQIELSLTHQLPLIFHLREAFSDFWPIFDAYPGLTGVVHSFSATTVELDEILKRGLYVGLNGIMTFTKNASQLAAAKDLPLNRLVLETDAPFLTPTPYRGTINEPKNVRVTAEFLAQLRGESLEKLAAASTANAEHLFGI